MDTATAISERRLEAVPSASAIPNATKTLTVTATYLLSEEGRKASLLDGGDGKAVQQLSLEVPANRLHLVSVDAQGVARLKLRPRYQLDGDRGIVRIDAAPTYDAPPDVEELFREAARNHQLERAYGAERQAAKIKRREGDQERRTAVARAFLSDPSRRAVTHPAPSPQRCVVETDQGRIFFDAKTDIPPARDVPAEALRRFQADLRGRREQNLKVRADQLALHEEKKEFAARWIADHGTTDQQARQAAGVLPIEEVIEAIAEHAFAVFADRPRYVPDGLSRLRAALDSRGDNRTALAPTDISVNGANAETMTGAQWTVVNEFRTLLPDATVVLRIHKISWRRDPSVPIAPAFGVLVTHHVGPFTVRREYEVHSDTGDAD
jgi:hypothetical protein